jgi:glycosyltransferase involved in cell wall biosynthesis
MSALRVKRGTVSPGTRSRSVVIVQEYVPEYRRAFFELLEAQLASADVRLRVAVGTPSAGLSARQDAATAVPMVQAVRTHAVTLCGRTVAFRRLSTLTDGSELVIADQALRHLESYPLLLGQRRGPRVALWGHGTRRVKRAIGIERALERRVTRAAHWFFAYTDRGADDVAGAGFPRSRITVVQNTIDTHELAARRAGISQAEKDELRSRLDLPKTNVCLYVGALDASKRIAFLLESCAIVARRIPEFALLIAGDGAERALIENSLPRLPWLRYVGRATGRGEAELGSVSEILLMPGRVGLVAVDSFALRTPIITTRWAYHAPEFEYLEDGVNARISQDSVGDFAAMVEHVLTSRDELERLKEGCDVSLPRYSLNGMVDNFARGVIAALDAPRR